MSSNPFLCCERQHFPEFSPMFQKKTPSSTEKQPGFRWSIDQIARLKPADIDTDPATLVKTNGHSPENHAESQRDVDKFFSQKTILPSPWPVSNGTSKLAAVIPTKRVTFSPHPPATAFIRDDSTLFESEIRDSRTADAGTQTALTFPMNFDLEHLLGQCLLGQVMNHVDDDGNRDLGNSSLRRKLFGKPDRQGSPDSSDSGGEGCDGGPPVSTETHPHVVVTQEGNLPNFTPISKNAPSKTSFPSGTSTPLHPSHSPSLSSHTPLHPSHYLQSPAVIFAKPSTAKYEHNARESAARNDNPAHSSMILQTPGKCVPFFSPIGDEGTTKTSSGSSSNKDTNHGIMQTNLHVGPLFPATPKGRSTSPPSVSPITSGPLMRTDAVDSPMVVCEGAKVKGDVGSTKVGAHEKAGGSKAKCTSTPNTGVMKRQLASSPFASPVLKHPRTARPDMEEEDDDEVNSHNKNDLRQTSSPLSSNHQQLRNNHNELTEDLAQPLSLADLKSETDTFDLTNVTSTACYTAMDLGETDFDDNTASMSRQHPLHSTAAFMAPSMWHPPIQSILGESHSQIRLNSLSQHQQSGLHSRNRSQVPASNSAHSVVDSGVAVAFSETVGASVTNLTRSKSASCVSESESGFTVSSSSYEPSSVMHAAREERHQCTNGGEVKGSLQGSDFHHVLGQYQYFPLVNDDSDVQDVKVGEVRPYAYKQLSLVQSSIPFSRLDSKHQVLSTIQEREENSVGPQNGKGTRKGSHLEKKPGVHVPCEKDSGLFSPDLRQNEFQNETHLDSNTHGRSGQTTSRPNEGNPILSHILTPPSRFSPNLLGTLPTSNINSHHPAVSKPSQQVHHISHNNHPTTNSATTSTSSTTHHSKFTSRRGIQTNVLPSRLKLTSTASMTPHSLTPNIHGPLSPTPSYSPMSTNSTPYVRPVTCTLRNFRHTTRTSSSSELWKPVFNRTPPSRYSSNLSSLKTVSSENSGQTSLAGFPRDVIQRKETLKARLQFSNSLSNALRTSSSSQYDSGMGSLRIPLGETSLNHPTSLLTTSSSHFNEGCSPLSPSPIGHARSPWQLPLVFSPVHRPITTSAITSSLSHGSHVTR